MRSSNLAGNLTDFGPSALDLSSPLPPPISVVQGSRAERLRKEVRKYCPRKPGVYGMVNRLGELVYIGKAKCLRTRLLSYFRPRSRDPKAGRVLRQAKAIAWETAANEFAALHRELELIERWRPRLNVLGQPTRRRFTFICIGRQPAPYAFLARRPPSTATHRFGPLPSGPKLHEAIRRLNDSFGLRDCSQSQQMIFADQTSLFPLLKGPGCLRHEIGTCIGPCVAGCSQSTYQRHVRSVLSFLEGNDAKLLPKLQRDMAHAAKAYQFERAATLRDKFVSLSWLDDRLAKLRHIRARESYVYPIAGHKQRFWYFIHAGQVLVGIPAPDDDRGRQQAASLIDAVYFKENHERLVDSYEHLESLLLVAAWFRKFPQERQQLLEPKQAMKMCTTSPVGPDSTPA